MKPITAAIGLESNKIDPDEDFGAKDIDLIKKKIQKAINMARSKGGNRYIIYKEFLHGEIEDSDK